MRNEAPRSNSPAVTARVSAAFRSVSCAVVGAGRSLAGGRIGPLVARSLWFVPSRRAARPPGADAQACAAAAGVMGRLSETMPALERSFLSAGERLMNVDACGRGLLEHCEQLLRLAGGDEEGSRLVKESIEVLRGPLAYIDDCLQRQQRLIELLADCETKAAGMIGVQERMHDAIAPLTFMAVMFKIESAYLPVEERETFTTVTSEVERLHKLVDETFAQNAVQLRRAHEVLRDVRRRLEADFAAQARHIAAKRAGIDGALASLETQLAGNAERDSLLHSHNRALASEIGRVVTGLQFQDIVKQKCDHVTEALLTVADGEGSRHLLALQASQLKVAERDLEAGCTAIADGLGRIGDLTEHLDRTSVSLESFGTMTAAVDGMVQLLLDTLADVHGIIRMVTALTEEGFSAVQPANGIARNLTSTTQELSTNMQLIALNAQVRSVQSGRGTGLETLAARTADISSEIRSISDVITTDLAALNASIDEMIGLFGDMRRGGDERLRALEAARKGTEGRLHALRDRTLLAMQQIGADAEEMRSVIAEAHRELSNLPTHCAQLREAGEALETASGEMAEAADAEALAAHAGRYTMESERAVHEALVAGTAALEGRAWKADTEAPQPAPAARESREQAKAALEPAAPAKADGLGDNVELF